MSIRSTAGPRDERDPEASSRPISRRTFLRRAGGVVGATATVAAIGVELGLGPKASAEPLAGAKASGETFAPLTQAELVQRRNAAYALRTDRARHWKGVPVELPLANDDALRYPDGWANFSKALPHDRLGHPDPAALATLVRACKTGAPADFAAIPLGGVQPLRNPQAGLAFECIGFDSNQTIIPPAPVFASAWRAGEMVEVYWASCCATFPSRSTETIPGSWRPAPTFPA